MVKQTLVSLRVGFELASMLCGVSSISLRFRARVHTDSASMPLRFSFEFNFGFHFDFTSISPGFHFDSLWACMLWHAIIHHKTQESQHLIKSSSSAASSPAAATSGGTSLQNMVKGTRASLSQPVKHFSTRGLGEAQLD